MGEAEERLGAEEASVPDPESSQLATDGLSKTCFGRRFIVDPAAQRLVDVGSGGVSRVVDFGMAGVRGALNAPATVMRVVGGERQTEVNQSETLQ